MAMNVFVSVGTGLTASQEEFVTAVEERLRAIGLNPLTIGRNRYSVDAPLHAVSDLMDECQGAVVIALERFRFPLGQERPGSSQQRDLTDVRLPTAWNQIEAAMAHSRGLPLLVIIDDHLRADGLLEKGNDWYVQDLPIAPASLNTSAFAGILDSWHSRLDESTSTLVAMTRSSDPASMTVGQLVGSLKPAQFWAILVALGGALGVAFAFGANFF